MSSAEGCPPSPRLPAGHLFIAFLRLGLIAFGGPAMVETIRDLAVRKRGWISEDSFRQGVSLCQAIPGATAMQLVGYIGLRAGGSMGALAAYLGFVWPAFISMVLLSALYDATRDVQPVLDAFRGCHVIVVALIANAAFSFGRSSFRKWTDVVLALFSAALYLSDCSPILVLLISGLLGRAVHCNPGESDRVEMGGEASSGSLAFALFIALIFLAGLVALRLWDDPLFALASLMAKVDLMAVGGGFASIPLISHEVVQVRGWMDNKTFMDGIALGQITPGPIVITATFVGYQVAGLWGAMVSTVGIFTPSFVLLLLAVRFMDPILRSWQAQAILRGLLASFVGLLMATTVRFGMEVSWTWWGALSAGAAFLALRLKADILWVIVVGTLVAMLQG